MNRDHFAGRTVVGPEMGHAILRSQRDRAPRPGERAPGFDLIRGDGEGRIRLVDLRGKQPVVLVFGSHT